MKAFNFLCKKSGMDFGTFVGDSVVAAWNQAVETLGGMVPELGSLDDTVRVSPVAVLRCVSDRYCDGDQPYLGVGEFTEMCISTHGTAPTLRDEGADRYFAGDVLVLVPLTPTYAIISDVSAGHGTVELVTTDPWDVFEKLPEIGAAWAVIHAEPTTIEGDRVVFGQSQVMTTSLILELL